MRLFNGAVKEWGFVSRLAIVGVALSLAWIVGMSLAAEARETTVEARVCSSTTSTAAVSINSPANDSIVRTLPITVSGSVQDVSQLTFTVDGAYSQTIAISTGQTSFSTDLSVNKGTRTIVVTGSDVCSVSDPSDTVVVTYQPKNSSGGGTNNGSNGSDTPTTVNPDAPNQSGGTEGSTPAAGGVVVGGPAIATTDEDKLEGLSVNVPEFVTDFLRITDMYTLIGSGSGGMARLVAVLSGLVLIITTALAPAISKRRSWPIIAWWLGVPAYLLGLILIVLALVL